MLDFRNSNNHTYEKAHTRMLIDSLETILSKCKAFKDIEIALDLGESSVLGAPPVVRSLLAAALFARSPRPTLIVMAGEDAARRFSLGLCLYLGRDKVMQLPAPTQPPWSKKDEDPHIAGRKVRALSALYNAEPVVVVASARSLLRLCPPLSSMKLDPVSFKLGEEFEQGYESIPDKLVELGYSRVQQAPDRGEFSIHGDSIDVFSAEAPAPVRIEFFGDEVDRIRRIVPSTGQTVCDLQESSVYAARELLVSQTDIQRAQNRLSAAGLLTYELEADLNSIALNGVKGAQAQLMPFLFGDSSTSMEIASKSTLTMLLEPRSIFDDCSRYYEELGSSAAKAQAQLEGLYAKPSELKFDRGQTLTVLSLIGAGSTQIREIKATRADNPPSDEKFAAQTRSLLSRGYTVVLGVGERRLREELMLVLTDAHIPISQQNHENPSFSSNVINIVDAPISVGVIVPEAHLALLNVNEGLTSISENGPSSRSDAIQISFPYKPGDYVVHAKHGIARFAGMERQEIDGIWRDYLLLEYAAGDKLFIPVDQMSKISKYVGSGADEPRLTRLNTQDWSKARLKASKAARKLAFDLVDLYVRRSGVQGYAYSPDTEMQKQMEDMFPYEETSDQARAIADVKADMESLRPMDRLICGDVGFGKTEVAIRAAFKAVQDGMQVMVLCPTTILAQQHFTTFLERFEPFPVNVEILSRFRTAAQQKKALEGFATGAVDVLIGTHRLLSHDVAPKRLGLVVIDEEQRFGVKHKEQLKNLREHIDVLTLTATPIPRTLQMSLGGVRDMSIINTAPTHRVPVETFVGEWDDDIVAGAIRREIARGGQVYFVSSRIKKLDDAQAKIIEGVPEARVGFAHGRMGEAALESVMESFAAGDIDVLVSTTIVESGLDNPHTNTLIITDSHMFGLSQLYQLKGRVGRSHIQAYAYFMFPKNIALTQEAIDRLVAIKENTELGSGIKIAMRDLEIRGAGSLLGAEQSGNISAIGFEAFMSMLSDYVDEARGISNKQKAADTVIDVSEELYIPEEYIPDVGERVEIYRRLANVYSKTDVSRLLSEMQLKYGELPEEAMRLITRAQVQIAMRSFGVESLVCIGQKCTMEPIELNTLQRQAASKAQSTYFAKSYKLTFRPQENEGALEAALRILDAIAAVGDTEELVEIDLDKGNKGGKSGQCSSSVSSAGRHDGSESGGDSESSVGSGNIGSGRSSAGGARSGGSVSSSGKSSSNTGRSRGRNGATSNTGRNRLIDSSSGRSKGRSSKRRLLI